MATTSLHSVGLNLLYQIIAKEQASLAKYAARQKQSSNPNLYYLQQGNDHIEALTQVYNHLETELSGTSVEQQQQQFGCNEAVATAQQTADLLFPEVWRRADKELSAVLQDSSVGIVLFQIDVPNRPSNRAFIHFPIQ